MLLDTGISNKDLYQILNRTFSNFRNGEDVSLSPEINIFTKKYQERLKTNPQIDIFEETPILPQNLTEVRDLLYVLEDYRETLDVDSKYDYLSEENYRKLAEGIEKYKNGLTPENKHFAESIAEYAKRYLPEYQDYYLLKDCTKEANDIYKRKSKKGDVYNAERNAHDAYFFLKRVMKGERIKSIAPSAEKIELYQASVKIVNCLTSPKYNRTFKFRLKRDLFDEISKCATALGKNYEDTAIQAKKERARFDKAIVNIKDFMLRKYGEDEWAK